MQFLPSLLLKKFLRCEILETQEHKKAYQEETSCHAENIPVYRRCMKKPGIDAVVKKGWCEVKGTTEVSLMDRIESCRTELSRWKKRSNTNSANKLNSLHKELEKEISKTRPNAVRMHQLKTAISEAYNEEECFWKQKSRESWLKEGDKNTRFFHNSVKGRKIQNKVIMLKDENGVEQYTEGSKGNIAIDYYKELFLSSNPTNFDMVLEDFPTKVTEEMNTMLTKEVSPEEIRQAAFSINSSSTPGEDGFSGAFYKRFWNVVGSSIVAEVQRFFNSSIIARGWNHTQLCLLPKVKNPTMMNEMRPISLCTVQYKIISKILCSRLKRILPEIISETQGAFVGGRLITDNIIIAHESIHALRTNDLIAEEYMAIKTDMSKAYDRVEWFFLEALLEKMGFCHIWIRWIMGCVSSVTYTIMLNGRTHGFIKPERGIRQGDPLSPFLFILMAEALVHSLNSAERKGNLSGIKISALSPSIHHLLFADDSLLLCKATEVESREVMHCLNTYGYVSGQLVNVSKSSIIFGDKVDESRKAVIKSILGIQKEGGEGSYLGLPECFRGSKRKLLSFIHEKLRSRLQGWYSKTLSQSGKEILIKSIGLALPIYAMSVFKLSKDLCGKLTSALTSYWWSNEENTRKIPWVAWHKLCRTKEEGGLNFQDIEHFNQSLLAKQAWKLLDNPNSLVGRILKGKYFPNKTFLECGLGRRPSYVWQSILHGRELLKSGLLKCIGDGRSTEIWSEHWLMDSAPRIPQRRVGNTDIVHKVSELMIPNTSIWDSALVHRVFSDLDAALILRIKPSQRVQDYHIWPFSKSGLYSVQSGRKFLQLQLNQVYSMQPIPPVERSVWSSVWKLKTLPKIKHFIWRSMAGALAVSQSLLVRNIEMDPTCRVCGTASESICHVLFACPLAALVWNLAEIPTPPMGFSSTSMLLNIFYLVQFSRKQEFSLERRMIFPWLLWFIWKARNEVVFEHKSSTAYTILVKAKEGLEEWNKANTKELEPVLDPPQCVSLNIVHWQRPTVGLLKCNVGSSWLSPHVNSGASWIIRNHLGEALTHSRRSFSNTSSAIDAHLQSLNWAIESMASLHHSKVVFEFSFSLLSQVLKNPQLFPVHRCLVTEIYGKLQGFELWYMNEVEPSGNKVASQIAESVVEGRRYHSYVAANGPFWLANLISIEASSLANSYTNGGC